MPDYLLNQSQKRGKSLDENEGLYQADVIQQMANRIYFKTKKDDGLVLRDRYSPFPIVALALILAAVRLRHSIYISTYLLIPP